MDKEKAAADLPANFLARVASRDCVVGVLGLGYVGLPLGLAFAEAGFPAIGFDVDAKKVATLEAGGSYIETMDAGRLRAAIEQGRLRATADFDRLSEPDVLLICVPTPLDRYLQPNLEYVVNTAEQISRRLRRGQLVVLESTTYPGTTDELVQPILERSGLVCGKDFFLAFSPEREDPGNQQFGTTAIPKVMGGVDEISGTLAEAVYRDVFTGTVKVSHSRVAEASKLTENIFRAVNIALVNELKVVYDAMGIDVWEVVDAAASKPFGYMKFTPGPGWGGHCIPVDPFYLSWKAREFGQRARFIELAGEINVMMPHYVIGKLQRALNKRGKPLSGAKLLVIGIAYKPDIADPRESPAFEILELLLESGAKVSYHDPHIPVAPKMRTWPDLPPLESVDIDAENVGSQDAVLVITNHSSIDYAALARSAQLIIDTRGVYRDGEANVVKA